MKDLLRTNKVLRVKNKVKPDKNRGPKTSRSGESKRLVREEEN